MLRCVFKERGAWEHWMFGGGVRTRHDLARLEPNIENREFAHIHSDHATQRT